MSTRPRPRPKPRARVPSAAPPSSPGTTSSNLPPTTKAKTPIVIDDADEDALFIRKGATADAWRKLDRIAEGALCHFGLICVKHIYLNFLYTIFVEKPKGGVIDLNSSDDEHKPSSSPPRKGKKAAMKPRVRQASNSSLPDWTSNADLIKWVYFILCTLLSLMCQYPL